MIKTHELAIIVKNIILLKPIANSLDKDDILALSSPKLHKSHENIFHTRGPGGGGGVVQSNQSTFMKVYKMFLEYLPLRG